MTVDGYDRYILCRHIYQCTPVELDEVPVEEATWHLQIYGMENKVQRERQSQPKKTGRGKKR